MGVAVISNNINEAQSQHVDVLRRVLIAASGSGGHLIPAVQIAQQIKALSPGTSVEFVGVGKPLEETLVVAKGFSRHTLPLVAVKNRGIIGLISFLFTLPKALILTYKLIKKTNPDIVVGVGGYVSVLPILVARFFGIPTWIHEAELYPGLANKVLSYFADNCSLAFAESKIGGRCRPVVTGHPVRSELATVDRSSIPRGVPERLLVLGGSQGARGLDSALSELATLLAEKKLEVVHQAREDQVSKVQAAYLAAGVKAHVVSFIDNMAGAFAWCDIIVSRSGAGSVAEIASVNRPTIFVPYPFQQGTHQTDNAKTLVYAQKALLVEESRDESKRSEFVQKLREAIIELCASANFVRMKKEWYEPRGLQAANRIAEGVLAAANITRPAV